MATKDTKKSSSTGRSLPPAVFHAQACLGVWEEVCTCILRLGKMLLYGLQGQQEGANGNVREQDMFFYLFRS